MLCQALTAKSKKRSLLFNGGTANTDKVTFGDILDKDYTDAFTMMA